MNKIYLKCQKTILEHKKKTILLDELYLIVSRVTRKHLTDLKTTEYDFFYSIVVELEKRGLLSNYGKNHNSKFGKSLFLKYKINRKCEENKELSEEDKSFIYSLNKKIDTHYYLTHVDEFNKDKFKINILNKFMNSITKNTVFMSINERSYELFGDEKCLSGNANKNITGLMKKVKISAEDICCFKSYTPLQCIMMPSFYSKNKRNILIVENLDTYWSLHRAFYISELGEKFDMLVYGGGNKAAGNFRFHEQYYISASDDIFYYGDIDSEGLAIFLRLKRANPLLNIRLCEELYELTLDIASIKGYYDVPNKNQSQLSPKDIKELSLSIGENTLYKLKNVIENGKYIPQEALNFQVLIDKYNIKR